MPLELSFPEIAAFGAIIAVAAVLLLVVVLGLVVVGWFRHHAARFRKLGIERTDKGDVQFSGYLNGQAEPVVHSPASFMDRVFGPSKFPSEDVPPDDEPPA